MKEKSHFLKKDEKRIKDSKDQKEIIEQEIKEGNIERRQGHLFMKCAYCDRFFVKLTDNGRCINPNCQAYNLAQAQVRERELKYKCLSCGGLSNCLTEEAYELNEKKC